MSTPVSLREGFFDSEGVRIRYVTAGQGSPVLLVHGYLGSLETWDMADQGGSALLRRLAERHSVIAVDARGHGKSDKPHTPGAYGLKMMDDLVRLLDHLHVERAHLVGYSMGGFLVSNLVLRHPERVKSAVFIGGVATTREEFERDEDFARAPFAATVGELLAGKGVVSLIRWLGSVGGPMSTLEGPALQGFNDMLLAGQDPVALAEVARGFPELFDVEARARAANAVPVLAMGGDLDVWLKFLRRYTAGFGNLTLNALRGVDHSIFGSQEADALTAAFVSAQE